MSKRNNRKKKHQFQSTKKEGGQSSKGSVEAKSATLDEKIDDLAHQSVKDSGNESAAKETTEVVSAVVMTEAKAIVKEAAAAPGEKKSNKAAKAFVWGLLIGAVVVSVLF